MGVESAAKRDRKSRRKCDQTAAGPAIRYGRPTPECLLGTRTQTCASTAGQAN